jgi:hypothetical protein
VIGGDTPDDIDRIYRLREFLIELGDWTCIDTTNEIAGAVLLTSIKRLIDEDEGPDGTETSQP